MTSITSRKNSIFSDLSNNVSKSSFNISEDPSQNDNSTIDIINENNIKALFNEGEKIGKGGFGKVRRIKIKDYVVKEIPIKKKMNQVQNNK